MKTMLPALAALALLAGPACKGDAKKVCNQAFEKYVTCVEKTVGPELAKMARQKKDIEACAKDERTVKMYKKCLPVKDCEKFMKCLEDYVKSGG